MASVIKNIKLTKIEITKFRSIHKAKISTEDITVFSGKNNSGKSNVLKALNLFFNSQSGFKSDHSHEKDYNLAFTGQAGGKREIEVKLYFQGGGNGALLKNFSISKKFRKGFSGEYEFWSSDEQVNNSIKNKDGNITKQFTGFLHKIEYVYIPAIRDKNFVNELLLLFEKLLEGTKGKEFRNKIGDLSEILKNKSQDINKNFQKFIGLQSNASLSTSVVDVLKAIVINIDSEIRIQKKVGEKRIHPVEIDLFSAGDGILMSYIPHFLTFICSKMSNKKFIWGFEEPENSLEYSKVQDLSEKFYNDFKKYAQILITTHSPAFIKLKEKKDVSFYRVYIDPKDETQSTQYKTIVDLEKQLSLFPIESEQYQYLQKELGFVEMSREIENFLEQWKKDEDNYKYKIKKLKIDLKKLFPINVFIYEDKNAKKLWEHLFLIWGINKIKFLSSNGSDNNNLEIIFKNKTAEKNNYNPKVFRQADRDGLTSEQIEKIENNKKNKFSECFIYKFKILPVHEIENFAILLDKTSFENIIEKHEELYDTFSEICENNLNKWNKYFSRKEDIFKNYEKNKTSMREEMRQSKILLLNGKEIGKLQQNFKPISKLLKLKNKNQFPKELQKYMNTVYIFFNHPN